jgi:ribosomal protein S6
MTEEKKHEDKEIKHETYELGYHLVPSLSEEDLALRVTDLQKAITAQGGSVIAEGSPESFNLAYTMKRLRSGKWEKYDTSFLGWVRFEASAEAVVALRETLEHSDFLIRHLLTKLEKAALIPAPVRKPRHESTEVVTEPKELKKPAVEEEKGEVSEKQLDEQIEQLIS